MLSLQKCADHFLDKLLSDLAHEQIAGSVCLAPLLQEKRTKIGGGQVFHEVASGAKTDRAQLRRVIDQLNAGDVLIVTWWSSNADQPVLNDLARPLVTRGDLLEGYRAMAADEECEREPQEWVGNLTSDIADKR